MFVKSWTDNGQTMTEWNIILFLLCDLTEWTIRLTFSAKPTYFEIWIADVQQSCVNTLQCVLKNPGWYSPQMAGEKLFSQVFNFHARFVNGIPDAMNAQWGAEVCSGQTTVSITTTTVPSTASSASTTSLASGMPTVSTVSTASTESTASTMSMASTTTTGTTNTPDYAAALRKSNLFYEAQRSGALPVTNRVSWRKDSALNDGSDVGLDLTGGYYDAGDYVKFNFPMASAVTLLAWGIIKYTPGYIAAGQLEYARATIKWPLDYFIKCHPSANELYGQVGNGELDHNFWGRPEDMTMERPAYKLTTDKPGSDLAGETAAAMAAGYIVFNVSDPTYAATLLTHAEQLYEFATTYTGKYSDSITDAYKYYKSYNGFKDELAWAAAWLHKATNNDLYLQDAKAGIEIVEASNELSWDDKIAGASLLVFEADTSHTRSKNHIKHFYDYWLRYGSNKVQMTPKGLAWHSQWGSLRYTANAVFALQVAAGLATELGLTESQKTDFKNFIKNQIDYMLGESGSDRSYVVGYGTNPPQRPHHASSSCPDASVQTVCDWDDFNSPEPNPHLLEGALVGGPDVNDNYVDDRGDYISNEVTCDYNAGFQSAIAGLVNIP